MQYLEINDDLRFVIEQINKELRVMITQGNEELACHKVSFTEFDTFLNTNKAHLFKGRLQLDNNNGVVLLKLKGVEVGSLDFEKIAAMLNTTNA